MAQVLFKGVPDFTQVHLEVAKIKQEIAGISTTPVRMAGAQQNIERLGAAAKGTAAELQKMSTTFDGNGNATRQVKEFSVGLGSTRRVVATLNKETGELAVTQKTLSHNFAQASRAVSDATARYEAYVQARRQAANVPTAMQRQIEDLTGVSTASKSAAESAKVFEKAFLDASGKVQKGTEDVTRKNNLLGDSFVNIYKKMLVWQVVGTMVSKTLGAFRDALDMMQKVDDELVTVRKVTGATAAELDALSEKAYKVASAYGEAADEYLSSVSAFARAGYGDQAADLAELATKTKLVGDTNAETAQQFLLSVDAAYQYKGNIEALSKVLDGSNQIDNKYATSLSKIAEGLGTVAPVAAQAHVGIDELTAAIGTITAVTQRSGTEAARAFRALVLNIVGDTKTEIDEGVTWTTGEIAGLRDVIKIYAKDAYDAAQATGEVINPMKAIGGLAQSMKDGLLTEQKLMEMVSDIGGKLRTSQLLALIQNWDMYESMLADYGNAVGSADKEVENALDSWTRKTNILSNTWAEFISHLVETDQIKGVLDGLIATVELLDTDFGRTVVTFGAVTAALYGIAGAAGAVKKAAAALDIAKLNPWILGIAAAATALKILWDATEDTRKSIDDLNADIQSSTEKLDENKSRLEEINETEWNQLTPEILAEKDALEEENRQLENQIQYYKELADAKEKAKSSSGKITVTGYTTETTLDYGEGAFIAASQTALTAAESERKAAEELEKFGDISEAVAKTESYRTKITLSGAEAYNWLTENANSLINALQKKKSLTEDEARTYAEIIPSLKSYIEYLRENGESTERLERILHELQSAYDGAVGYIDNYVDGLLKQAAKTAEAKDNLYDLVQSEIEANKQNLNFSQQIAALRTLAVQAGYAASAIATVFGMDENSMSNQIRAAAKGLLQAGLAENSHDAMLKAKQNYMNALWGSLTDFYTPESDGGSGGGSPSGSTKSKTDKVLEAHKENVSLLKSELTLMEKQGKSVGEQVAKIKAIQNALHQQAEYMRSIGASQDEINALSAEWYDWQEKIAALQKSLLSELDSAVQKKLDDAKADRDAELDAIQAQIDALKEKNEAEDAALAIEEKRAAITEKQNDLLEKQKALLEARNERTVRTYNAKTNQWEWIADEKNVRSAEDALKSAQEALEKAKDDLADYNKKLERDAEIAALEAKKDQINAHYDALENAWNRIMDSLDDPVREINDILKDIAENATPELREQILKNRDLFEELGIDLSIFGDRVEQTANRLVKVLANGSAPSGLGVGDRVVTAAGTYEITGVNPDGSYESRLVDRNQTTGNYNGEYDYGAPNPSRRIAKVRSNGSAPPGLDVGDWVVTAAGTYQITAVNPDGSYQSALIDRSMTTRNYTGRYDVYDRGGWLNGTGGIKATSRPETVLPPELTEKLLSPAADATFQKRMSELGFLYGTTDRTPVTAGGTVTNSNVTNNYGARYHYGNVVLTEEQARGMSLYQLMKLSGGLGNFNNM